MVVVVSSVWRMETTLGVEIPVEPKLRQDDDAFLCHYMGHAFKTFTFATKMSIVHRRDIHWFSCSFHHLKGGVVDIITHGHVGEGSGTLLSHLKTELFAKNFEI